MEVLPQYFSTDCRKLEVASYFSHSWTFSQYFVPTENAEYHARYYQFIYMYNMKKVAVIKT